MTYLSRAHESRRIDQGRFAIRLLSPGLEPDIAGDSGLGPLGRLDHSTLEPGGLISMHSRKNDEILSHMRRATMRHTDSRGLSKALHGTRMMKMNAGMGLPIRKAWRRRIPKEWTCCRCFSGQEKTTWNPGSQAYRPVVCA